MSSNLQVKITADVVDLQTKFGLAKAETAGLSAEINKLQRAQAAGSLTVLPQAMQQLTGDLIAAKTQAAALGAKLYETSGGLLGVASAAEHGHGSISTATREFRALFDELSSGRTRQTPGTIAILLQRVAGLSPAMLGAVAGVGALAGGLAYLAIQANKAGNEINQIDISSTFAGNMDITRTVIERYITELSKAGNVSSSEARKIVASFAEIPGMTSAALGTLSATMSQFAQETHQSADKAAEDWAKLFAGNVSAGEFAKKLEGITQLSQGQLDQARSADQSGDAAAVMTEKLRLLDQVVSAGAPGLKTYATNAADLATALAAGESGTDQMELQTTLVAANTAVIDKDTEARRRNLAVQAQTAATPQQSLQAGIKVADQENPVAKQIDEDNAKIQVMETALAAATDPAQVKLLTAALAETGQKLQDLQAGPVLERMRTQIQEVAATWDGSQTGMLAKQVSIAQAGLANVRQGSRQELEVKSEVTRLEVELRRAASEQVIASARQQVAEIGSIDAQSALSRAAQEHAVWEAVLGDTRLTAQARIQVERDVATSATAIQRAAAAEQATITRQNIATDISISKLQIEAEKNALDLGTAATAQAVAQRLAMLRQLTAAEFALNNQQLQDELGKLDQSPEEYNRVYNEIRELKAKLVIDLENLDKQAAAESKKYAQEQAKDWHGVVAEIEGAESGFVSDILTKRKSLSQSLLSLGADLATKEIANDLKAVTTRILLDNTAANAQKATEQGGVIYHLLTQNQQTAATVQAQTAQTAAVNTGNVARLASTTTANAASKSQAAATNGPTVMADAAKAFSGTYASVSQIPYVGWILAPAAASAAFAAVAAYEGLASLDVGTNYVPQTGPYMLHEGEAVQPKAYNPAAGGGDEGGGGGYTEVHNYNGDVHASSLDARGMATLFKGPGGRRAIAAAARTYFYRGGR